MRLRDVCLFVGRTYLYEIKPSCFPKFLDQFSSSHWSIFSPKIGINKLKLVNLTNTKGYLFVVLICIFLITHGIEHIFIRLLAIRNFSWVKCLIRSLPIFYWVVFFLLIYGSSVYILDNYPATVMCIKNIFLLTLCHILKTKKAIEFQFFPFVHSLTCSPRCHEAERQDLTERGSLPSGRRNRVLSGSFTTISLDHEGNWESPKDEPPSEQIKHFGDTNTIYLGINRGTHTRQCLLKLLS